MAYGKDIYSNILEEYDEKRELAERKAEAFDAALCARSPEYAAITKRLSGIGVRLLLAGRAPDKEAKIAEIRRETEELRARRIEVLAELGYKEEDADVHYECAECSDTGYTDNGICACLKRK
ncbi:MAG: hypothetical protein II370_06285, partial [Clostridia bacterium]|nr:hypothetical protein [Clostridia bacterium]